MVVLFSKKGVLFSTVTVIFFILLVTLSGTFTQYGSFLKDSSVSFDSIIRESNLRTEIATNYVSIMDITFGEIAVDRVSFSSLLGFERSGVVNSYVSFMETTYASRINVPLSLDLDTSFTLYPQETTFMFGGSNLSFTLTNISEIYLDITLDAGEFVNESVPLSESPEHSPVHIIIRNNDSSIIFNEDIYLDFSESNTPFEVSSGAQSATVSISQNGFLLDLNEGLTAEITALEIGFNAQDYWVISTGTITQRKYSGDIVLNSFVQEVVEQQ